MGRPFPSRSNSTRAAVQRRPNSLVERAPARSPVAGLLKDLKQRGLLDEPLVVWGGEFGRTTDNSMDFFRSHPGRNHNKDAMIMWFAGAGIKGGTVVGATDELGIKAAENVYHIKNKETCRLAGELARLTGETMTGAIIVALRERLAQEGQPSGRVKLR